MLTIEELGKISGGKPENLPVIYVHDIDTWTGPSQVDTKGRIHMNYLQMYALKKDLPLARVRRIGPSTEEYKIALERHHLIGGGDKPVETKEAGQTVMMDKIGPASEDIAKERRKKTALIKRPANRNIH